MNLPRHGSHPELSSLSGAYENIFNTTANFISLITALNNVNVKTPQKSPNVKRKKAYCRNVIKVLKNRLRVVLNDRT